MKVAEVADNVKRLVDEPPSRDGFVFELLLAYGSPKSGVTLLKKGTRNLSKVPSEVLWKNKVYFKPVNVSQASSLPEGADSPQDAGGKAHEDQLPHQTLHLRRRTPGAFI
ncbi:MAG: hypothetical protein ABFR33_05110 [Verrucomicrobiota bacterium]